MRDGKIASGSHNGVVKIIDPSKNDNKTPVFSLDPNTIVVKTIAQTSDAGTGVETFVSMTKINCMAVWKDLVIYGDGGYNLKVLDYKKGKRLEVVLKVCFL